MASISLEELVIFRDYLKKYHKSLVKGYLFRCEEDVQPVFEYLSYKINVTHHSRNTFSDVKVDDSREQEWIMNNPGCISREEWEKFTYKICPRINFRVVSVKEAAKFIKDIKVNYINESCPILYTISIAQLAAKKNCYDVSVKSIEDCKRDYKVLVNEVGCNFDFDVYAKLLECNLSNKVITKLVECGLDLGYSPTTNTAIIITEQGEYNLADIDINIISESTDYELLSALLGISEEDVRNSDLEYLLNSYSENINGN